MSNVYPKKQLSHERVVRFGETDAAGVIHFHHLFRWFHVAWEESLEVYGLKTSEIFPVGIESKHPLKLYLPIVHCEADFRLPICTGDHLLIKLSPRKIKDNCFEIIYTVLKSDQIAASGLIRHCSIDSKTRQRTSLPEGINRWIEALTVNSSLTHMQCE